MRKLLCGTSVGIICLVLFVQAAGGQGPPQGHGRPEVSNAVKHDRSRPLREIQPAPRKPAQPEVKPRRTLPPRQAVAGPDPVVQNTAAPVVATTNGLNLPGVGADFVGPQGSFPVETAPSDSNGAAGATQYVQWVNTSFAVLDKQTGAVQYGPVTGDTLWAGFGGPCEANNDGDPIVRYDRAAGRWILTQLAVAGGPPFFQCIAVSTTADATGAYERYSFQYSDLNDYPKLGVWPDAYYFTFNLFQGNTFLGAKICAMDRNQMLMGGPATQQCFQLATSFGAVLPSDLDGATPPPAGSPAFLMGFGTNVLNLWKFHVDFANSANSALTGPTAITVAPYTEACATGACISQSGTSQKLDAIGDRLMYRLAYRNFGDHESLVVNHSVKAGNTVGVRWYEVRNPGTTAVLYQQSTYSPDSSARWMGSIAMDKAGNIALGYSVSSNAMHPSIRYTGRAPADPLGTMQAENVIIEGTGSQLPFFGAISLDRWGDYTSMAVDPIDDCTFWYTNQYLISSGSFNWSTRIASFSFPSCLAAPPTQDFFLSVVPGSRLVAQGAAATHTVSVNASGGFTGTVGFAVTGLPSGATASFSPATVAGSGSTTLTITTGLATPPGSYPVTITATSGSLSHSALVTLNVFVPAVAAFVKADTVTQGTWKGVYGSNGYSIANDSTSLPAYAVMSLAGQNSFIWAASTTDVRALQKGAATDRIASTWYSGATFTIDINLLDGASHQVALYCVDWDTQARAQTIDVLDGNTNAVLDSRSLSAFTAGQYLLWNLSGHIIIRVTRTGGLNAVVSGLFFDPPAAPDFTLAAAPSSQMVAQGGAAAYTVSVSALLGFSGAVSLGASGLPLGATASFSPATITGSGSATLTINTTATTPGGSYPITITGTSGALSHSASVTMIVTASVAAAATFLKADTTTQGTWKGVYGANGFAIANDATSYPAYSQVSLSGQNAFTWAASTTDVRALQKGAATDRIASTWYSATSFTIDVNLTDGASHQVAIYCMDWDNQARVQTVDILDATSGAVLDTRSLSAFLNGQWLVWNLAGHVNIRVTRTGGNNAVISGIFFDAPVALPPDFSIAATPASQTLAPGTATSFTVTVTPSGGFSGAVSLGASGLPLGATASFSPATITGSGSATLTINTAATTPGGSYPITITGTSGALSHSASVTMIVTASVPAAATFLKADTTTQGTWKGVYGANGFAIANDATSYPAYSQVSLTGQSAFTWMASTTDVRALQKGAATDRIASTWYSATSFTIDVNLTDGATHQVAIYCMDWDNQARVQTVDILDATSGAVLDTRSLSAFLNGQWLVWNLAGHVNIRVTRTGGNNAVISGIFF